MRRRNNSSVALARCVLALACIVPVASEAQQLPAAVENRSAEAAIIPLTRQSAELVHLQEQYVIGTKLLAEWRTVSAETPDAQIIELSQRSSRWYAENYAWIEANIGPQAAAQFGQWVSSDTRYTLAGDHNDAVTRTYVDELILAPQYLENLNALIRAHDMQPQK